VGNFVNCLVLIYQLMIGCHTDNHLSRYHTNVTSITLVNRIYVNYCMLDMNLDNCYPIFVNLQLVVFSVVVLLTLNAVITLRGWCKSIVVDGNSVTSDHFRPVWSSLFVHNNCR